MASNNPFEKMKFAQEDESDEENNFKEVTKSNNKKDSSSKPLLKLNWTLNFTGVYSMNSFNI